MTMMMDSASGGSMQPPARFEAFLMTGEKMVKLTPSHTNRRTRRAQLDSGYSDTTVHGHDSVSDQQQLRRELPRPVETDHRFVWTVNAPLEFTKADESKVTVGYYKDMEQQENQIENELADGRTVVTYTEHGQMVTHTPQGTLLRISPSDGISCEENFNESSNAINNFENRETDGSVDTVLETSFVPCQAPSENDESIVAQEPIAPHVLARQLFDLDGFQKSQVAEHMCGNDAHSQDIAHEYLQLFNFSGDSVDLALRLFLARFALSGESQERERILWHFADRYVECNKNTVFTNENIFILTCAIMLLNTDLHGQNVGKKMSASQFIRNLDGKNSNFPCEMLTAIYNSIKRTPLEWARDKEDDVMEAKVQQQNDFVGFNPFLQQPDVKDGVEFIRGSLIRKCCRSAGGENVKKGKRGWKKFYARLVDLVLFLGKNDSEKLESLKDSIRIHHALACIAEDYKKRSFVMRLLTPDGSEFLFEAPTAEDCLSWVDTINLSAALLSSRQMPAAVSGMKTFQRPLTPAQLTSHTPKQQMENHGKKVVELQIELDQHRQHPPSQKAGKRAIVYYQEKDAFLVQEMHRYSCYQRTLIEKLGLQVESSEGTEKRANSSLTSADLSSGASDQSARNVTDRYSYRAAIYNIDCSADGGSTEF